MEQFINYLKKISYGKILRKILTISFIVISLHMSVPGILIIIKELNNSNQAEVLKQLIFLYTVLSLIEALIVRGLFEKNDFIDLFITALFINTTATLCIIGLKEIYIFFSLFSVGLYLLIKYLEKTFSKSHKESAFRLTPMEQDRKERK